MATNTDNQLIQLVERYIYARTFNVYSNASEIFTDNVRLCDMMIMKSIKAIICGRDAVIEIFTDMFACGIRVACVEAVSKSGSNQMMVMYKVVEKDRMRNICDLLTVQDGKICHVVNIYRV